LFAEIQAKAYLTVKVSFALSGYLTTLLGSLKKEKKGKKNMQLSGIFISDELLFKMMCIERLIVSTAGR